MSTWQNENGDSWQVGVLGDRAWRIACDDKMPDLALLQSLHAAHPKRHIVCLATPSIASELQTKGAKVISQAVHMTAAIASVCSKLGEASSKETR